MVAELLDIRDGVALGQLGPLCIALWREEVTRPRFERQATALAAVVAAHRGNAGFLCIVEPASKAPNDELRRASARMIDAHGADLAFVAAVIEGSGFQAAITRSVLTAISLFITRNKTKIGFFSNAMDAALWGGSTQLCPRPGQSSRTCRPCALAFWAAGKCSAKNAQGGARMVR